MAKNLSLKEKSYIEIKEKIMNLEYKPGEYLEENVLSKELNVSRTPMREAIARLQEEGWVDVYPRKGIYVSEVTEELIEDIYEARISLEVLSLKNSKLSLNKLKLEILKEKVENTDGKDIVLLDKLDYEFHNVILGLRKNKFLSKVSINVMEQMERVRIMSKEKKLPERARESIKEHIEIIDFLLEERVEDAEKVLVEHLKKAEKYFLKILLTQ